MKLLIRNKKHTITSSKGVIYFDGKVFSVDVENLNKSNDEIDCNQSEDEEENGYDQNLPEDVMEAMEFNPMTIGRLLDNVFLMLLDGSLKIKEIRINQSSIILDGKKYEMPTTGSEAAFINWREILGH